MRRPTARLLATLAATALACAEPTDVDVDAEPRRSAPEARHAAPESERAAPEPERETCEGCHEDEAREHRASAHARAFTSPLFQREWHPSESDFCLPCHAPRTTDPDAQPELARLGVDCESCHGSAGEAVLATRVSGRAPHESRVEPRLATTEACAGCHQVDLPELPGQPLQDTVAEWRAAGEPGGACQSCHVPRTETGRARHHFPGGHQPSMLRDALTITARAERDGWDTRVVLRLEATGAGHAVPTGDVFRRLVVRAWRDDRPTEGALVELGRHFDARAGRPWAPARDDRVPAGGLRDVVLRVRGRPARVRWSVEMWSVPQSEIQHTGLAATALHRPFASGTLDLD